MTQSERAAFADQVNVSRETLERLDIYADLLERWTGKINLVSKGTLGELWTRHFLDSAQLLDLAPQGKAWADLGSGGGFPGAVVAVIAAELRPRMRVTLVEADQRKAAFLRTILRETGVMGRVLASRIESLEPLGADILSARALASLDHLLGYAQRHLKPSGRALFMKGEKAEEEIAEALERWRFDCERYVSKTDKDAVILSIGDIERV